MDHRSVLQKTDRCVMCGLCLPHCPTYVKTRNEGESPRGRIALMQGLFSGRLELTEHLEAHLDHCLACRTCEAVCPSGVPYGELIDAARVDGASELRIVFSVVAPAVVPAIAALALFAFVYHWNTYLWPLTVLQGNSADYPIVLSLGRLLSYNRGAMNTGLVMAGATLAVLPPLVLFVFLQRFFVDSIVSSGVKG